MDRKEAENALDYLYGLPTGGGSDELQAATALVRAVIALGADALSDKGLERVLDEQKDIFAAEARGEYLAEPGGTAP